MMQIKQKIPKKVIVPLHNLMKLFSAAQKGLLVYICNHSQNIQRTDAQIKKNDGNFDRIDTKIVDSFDSKDRLKNSCHLTYGQYNILDAHTILAKNEYGCKVSDSENLSL